MTTEAVIYKSSNGDRWHLLVEDGSDGMLVRHRPNRASRGRPSVIDLKEFVSEGHGPQQEALLELLHEMGYLVAKARHRERCPSAWPHP